ncbi:hypothetical protein ACJX0J_027369, partial [Zea mays]
SYILRYGGDLKVLLEIIFPSDLALYILSLGGFDLERRDHCCKIILFFNPFIYIVSIEVNLATLIERPLERNSTSLNTITFRVKKTLRGLDWVAPLNAYPFYKIKTK